MKIGRAVLSLVLFACLSVQINICANQSTADLLVDLIEAEFYGPCDNNYPSRAQIFNELKSRIEKDSDLAYPSCTFQTTLFTYPRNKTIYKRLPDFLVECGHIAVVSKAFDKDTYQQQIRLLQRLFEQEEERY